VAVTKGFRRLRWIADHEAGVGVRQIKSGKEVDFALYAADDADGLTKVYLTTRCGFLIPAA
jgi:hypothetical protein